MIRRYGKYVAAVTLFGVVTAASVDANRHGAEYAYLLMIVINGGIGAGISVMAVIDMREAAERHKNLIEEHHTKGKLCRSCGLPTARPSNICLNPDCKRFGKHWHRTLHRVKPKQKVA